MISLILNDKITWRFLLFLSYSKGRGYKFNEFKTALHLNNSSLYKIIEKLEFYNVLKKEKTVYKIDFTQNLSVSLFDIIEKDKKIFNGMDWQAVEITLDFLSKIDKNTFINNIYIFGSYVKRTNSTSSDIDIAIISNQKIDLFENVYALEEKYKKKIEIHYFLENEFKKNTSKLIQEIKRDGIKLV